MSDFNWKRKERLQEQLKFFGAKKTRFISCYAKKPKVRVKNKTLNSELTRMSQEQGLGLLGASGLGVGGAGMANLMGDIGSQLANQKLWLSQARQQMLRNRAENNENFLSRTERRFKGSFDNNVLVSKSVHPSSIKETL